MQEEEQEILGGYGNIVWKYGSVNAGSNYRNGVNTDKGKGENGTGGLLIIYSDVINNIGKIASNGSKGGSYTNSSKPKITSTAGGGNSGGGSINIFYKTTITNSGKIEASGQVVGYAPYGAYGGNGCISIGTIKTGTYKEL